MDSTNTCTICHNEDTNIHENVDIVCNDNPTIHKFHMPCMNNWFKTNLELHQKLPTCPICRGKLNISDTIWKKYRDGVIDEINANNSEIKTSNEQLNIYQTVVLNLKLEYNNISQKYIH